MCTGRERSGTQITVSILGVQSVYNKYSQILSACHSDRFRFNLTGHPTRMEGYDESVRGFSCQVSGGNSCWLLCTQAGIFLFGFFSVNVSALKLSVLRRVNTLFHSNTLKLDVHSESIDLQKCCSSWHQSTRLYLEKTSWRGNNFV